MLPETYQLYSLPEKYILLPENSKEVIIIDRVSQEISARADTSLVPLGVSPTLLFGIWGTMKLLSGQYLIVIRQRERVGDLFGHVIWKIKKSEILPFARSKLHMTDLQAADEKTYLQMLEFVLQTDGFYYSTSYDLTHTLQRLSDTSPDFKNQTLLDRADDRFVWNRHLLEDLSQQPDLARFCLPVMHGYVNVVSQQWGRTGHTATYALISRRNLYRAGMRLFMRGADQVGNAANNVETEQIFHYNNNRFSFVQTRGSIPLLWSQRPNLRYKPVPHLSASEAEQEEVARRHFDSQMYLYRYGTQVAVNLIDQVGLERPLERAYARAASAMDPASVKYESFDFHRECKGMRADRLKLLVDRLDADLDALGYLHLADTPDSTVPQVVSRQAGVFRTNCVDCLDRTNVIQSLLAWRSLERQCVAIGLLHRGRPLVELTGGDFEMQFKSIWGDNADMCSIQYTGTGAMKTDITRTGKRTILGQLNDGYNSLARYFFNNFRDGFRQDAIDLFLGNYVVDETRVSPLRVERDWKTYLPIVFLFAFAMFVLCCLFPTAEWTEQAMYLLFWGTTCVFTVFVIFTYGEDYVDRPRLRRLESIAIASSPSASVQKMMS